MRKGLRGILSIRIEKECHRQKTVDEAGSIAAR